MKNDTNNMSYLLYRAQTFVQIVKLKESEELDVIYEAISEYKDMTYDVMRLKSRKRHIVKYRQICMHFMKKTKATLNTIAEYFGGFDHTTVIHSIGVVSDLIASDEEYRNEVSKIENAILTYRNKFNRKQLLINETQNTAA